MNTPKNAQSPVAVTAARLLCCDTQTQKSDREWLQAVAKFDPRSEVPWNNWVETIFIEDPPLGARVLYVQHHGIGTLEGFQTAIEAGMGPLIRGVSPVALKAALAAMGEGPRSVELAARWVAMFRKATPDALRMADRCGWRIEVIATAIPENPDPSLGAWILANSQNWPSRRRGEQLMSSCITSWTLLQQLLLQGQQISPMEAERAIKVAQLLSPKWATVPFGLAIGKVKMNRVAAYRAAQLWAAALAIPSVYPTDREYRCGDYVGSFSPRVSLDAMTVGYATDCCQHLGGEGEPCAIDSQMNPTSGVFTVRDRDNRVIAQSWVWLSDDSQGVCFDSIEWKAGALNGAAKASRAAMLQQVYQEAASDMANRWGVPVHVGVGYTDTDVISGLPEATELMVPQKYADYRDSSEEQRILAEDTYKGPSTCSPVDGFTWLAETGASVNTSVCRTEQGFTLRVEDRRWRFTPQERDELARTLGAANPHMNIEIDGATYRAINPIHVAAVRAAADADGGMSSTRIWDSINTLVKGNGPTWSDWPLITRLSLTEAPPTQWLALRSAGLSAQCVSDYAEAGVPWKEWLALASAGLRGPEARLYVEAGVPWAEWSTLASAGLRGTEACSYAEAGVPWKEWLTLHFVGISDQCVNGYLKAGVPWKEWSALASAGLRGIEARYYAEAGVPKTQWLALHSVGINWADAKVFTQEQVPWSEWTTLRLAGINWSRAKRYSKMELPWQQWVEVHQDLIAYEEFLQDEELKSLLLEEEDMERRLLQGKEGGEGES